MRVGSMGHSGFTNWENKKEKTIHHWNRTHKPFIILFPSTHANTGVHQTKALTLTDTSDSLCLNRVSSITAKLGLLQALLSQFLPVTKVQAQIFIRTGQSCKASAKKLVPVLGLPSCLLRGHFYNYVIFFSEARATLQVP